MMNKIILFALGGLLVAGCNLRSKSLDTPLGASVLESTTVNESVLGPVYASYRDLYGEVSQMLNLEDISSDAFVVPFRGGTDWFDGGRYIAMHTHTWTANDVTVTSVWSRVTQAIAKAAFAQKVIKEHMDAPDAARYLAEARAMGAFWNQVLLNLYGVAAFKDPDDLNALSKIYRGEEAVKYILDQYSQAEPDLGNFSSVGTTHFTKAAVWAFKARLFLNKPVYADVYSDNYNFSKQDMDSVILYSTKVIDLGNYSLSNDYFGIFNINNGSNTEIIFAFGQSLENDGSNRLAYFPVSRAMHGSLTNLSAQGTDALALTELAYNRWNGQHGDPRYFKAYLPLEPGSISPSAYQLNRGIQVGQQYGIILNPSGTGYLTTSDGDLVIDSLFDTPRSGAPVNYTPEVGIFTNNAQVNGTRPFKYMYDPLAQTSRPGRVNLPMMRYADVWLMRSEAYLREGLTGLALDDVNYLRSARGTTPTVSLDLNRMFLERFWELYYEFQSRTDEIRFGMFDSPWLDKTNTDPTRRLFPIPQNVINASSGIEGYLEQNRGY